MKINLVLEVIGAVTIFGLGLLTGLYVAPDAEEADEDDSNE